MGSLTKITETDNYLDIILALVMQLFLYFLSKASVRLKIEKSIKNK